MKLKFNHAEFQKKMDKKAKAVLEEVDKTLNEYAIKVEAKADELAPIDTSDLVNSINHRQSPESSETKIIYQVYADAPHAPHIEFGTKPHRVSREGQKDLARWVSRKFGISDPEELYAVTFAVARKIARRGTKAKPFLRPAYYFYERRIREDVKKAVKNGLKKGGGS